MYKPVWKLASELSTLERIKVKAREMVLKFYGISFDFDPAKFPNLDMVKYQEYLKPSKYSQPLEPTVQIPGLTTTLEIALFPSCRAQLRDLADDMNQMTYLEIMDPLKEDWELVD